jgi:hypothetical protein
MKNVHYKGCLSTIDGRVNYWLASHSQSTSRQMCAAIARRLGRIWVEDPLPRQADAVRLGLRKLGRQDFEDGGYARQRGGRLVLVIEDQAIEVRNGRQLKIALARYQMHNTELWISFRIQHGYIDDFYREPSLLAYEAAFQDGDWRERLPEMETAQDEAEPLLELKVPEAGEMTVSELARQIGWPGSARSLVAVLPRISAEYGWLAEPVMTDGGTPKRENYTRRPLYNVSIFPSFHPAQ